MTTPSLQEHAIAYAAAGFEVVRLAPRSKKPAISHAVYSATTDQSTIRSWWDESPSANIGLRVPKGCILLDIDPRNGGSLEQIAEFGRTAMSETGGGGWHLLYRFGRPIRGLVSGTDGVEIKGRQQYFVAAPSVHPVTGRTYRWVDMRPPVHLPPVAWPRVEREFSKLLPVHSAASAGADRRWQGLERVVRQASPGKRNSTLYWAVCRAVEAQAPSGLIEKLSSAAESSGLDRWEVDGVCRSALGRSRE